MGGTAPVVIGQENPVNFNRDIRAILSNACIQCHGPDPAERKGGPKGSGGLRLDTEEGSRMDLGGTAAISPGHPELSGLIARITSTDPDEVMPPPKSGKKISADQVKLLSAWIKAGGNYAKHWAYEPPVRPEVPGLASHPVDAFILDRLAKEGLKPQPEADRATLARRAALDITGLPPSPERVEAFLNDREPEAYERYVDSLLASSAYGEHWGREWLDLARYADSAGYADDRLRTIWAYRDYVIKSFNANKPFDQFTIEQMAGDLLPNPTDDQLVATAFHRNTMTNSEGGTNDEEFRNAAIVDRVNTTMTVWMGTSMACAQCHTHKYDPLTQHEYFQMFAFLNNTADADRQDESPLHEFYSPDQKDQRQNLEAEIAALEVKLKSPSPQQRTAAEQWSREFAEVPAWEVLKPAAVKSAALLPAELATDGTVLVPKTAEQDTLSIEVSVPTSRKFSALRLEALPHDSLPGNGPGHSGGNFVVTRVRAVVEPPVESVTVPLNEQREILFTDAAADFIQQDFDEDAVITDHPPATPKPGKKPRGPQKGWAIGGQPGQPHQLILAADRPVDLPAGSKLRISIGQQSPFANHTLGRFRLSLSDDPAAVKRLEIPADLRSVIAIPPAQRTSEQQDRFAEYYVGSIAPELAEEREKVLELRKQIEALKPVTVPVLTDLPADKRRRTKVQVRGNYLIEGDEVTEGVPAVFNPLPPGAPMNRLTLARWLVDGKNPLTARVLANRLWESIFGIGLVRTSEEFGSQGEPPSHPELMDWLATELIRTQWDQKKFIRLLVTSQTYRQSSKVEPGAAERDPENRLLARGPRFRHSAEMVRDQALAVSGLLSPVMFGPSVRPLRPAMGLSAAFGGGLDWQTSGGQDRFRRALYTEWRRTSPYPSMSTFDAPNRETCTIRRGRTNTPLQALVTLNDPVYVEAAQALARRLSAGTPDDKITQAFRFVLSRPPSDKERQRILQLHGETLAFYQADAKKAADMATNPIGPLPVGADAAELAAWSAVCGVLLNLDETLMKR